LKSEIVNKNLTWAFPKLTRTEGLQFLEMNYSKKPILKQILEGKKT